MPNQTARTSLSRYRLLMGVGGALLLGSSIIRHFTGDLDNLITRDVTIVSLLTFALIAPYIKWIREHHHLAAAISVFPLSMHMAYLSYTTHLAHEWTIGTMVVLGVIASVIDSRLWLRIQMSLWCSIFVTMAWFVEEPMMSPVNYTVLMILACTFMHIVGGNFFDARTQLQRNLAELKATQNFANIGSWELNLKTREAQFSPIAYDILGYPMDGPSPKLNELLARGDNEDLSKQVRAFINGRENFDAIGEIVSKTKGSVWVHTRGTTLYENGRAVRKFGVLLDITSQVEREQKLKAAKQAAESAVEARTLFLANMSHEIRTPMNGVIGMTSLLEQEELSGDVRRYVDIIRSCGESLLATINDILDFTKLDAGKVVLEQRVFNTTTLIEDSANMVRNSIKEKGLALIIEGDALDLELLGDPMRLQQILVNLLANATKFTETGTITLRATKTAGTGPRRQGVNIQVIDTGIGISEKAQQSLFSPFTQADASTTRQYGGTGLGLTISHKLAKQMDGALNVHSKLGHGTTFTLQLSLPLAMSDISEAKAKTIDPSITSELRILLAEDNPVNQTVATRMLQRLGFEPDVVDNGAQAVEKMQTNTYDLILMDVQMPEMDGLEATTNIRMIPGIAQPRIIALTANAMREDRSRCIDAGMDDFLAKPVRLEDLRSAIAANL